MVVPASHSQGPIAEPALGSQLVIMVEDWFFQSNRQPRFNNNLGQNYFDVGQHQFVGQREFLAPNYARPIFGVPNCLAYRLHAPLGPSPYLPHSPTPPISG